MSWPARGILAAILAVFLVFAWAILARKFAPRSNTSLTHFDAILVLGTPADSDGNPTPPELARVTEAVHEYERGVAPRLIFTGGAVANRFVEAQVMAHAAEAQGIPEPAVLVEPQARDTIQNACYSVRIMNAHGWRSAEVISNAWHLKRSALIFGHTSIQWSMHAAPSLEPESGTRDARRAFSETINTVRYLVWERQMEKCEP
ncbi:MAG: YdcF family protein [Terracidiphilus sp.]